MPLNFGLLDTSLPGKIATSLDEGRQNRLAELAQKQAMDLQGYQLESAKRSAADDAAYRDIFKRTSGNIEQAIPELYKAGMPKQGIELQKQLTDQRNAKIEQAKKHLELISEASKRVLANPTMESAVASIRMVEQQTGTQTPEEYEALKATGGDPQKIAAWAAGHAAKANDLMPKLQTINLGNVQRQQTTDWQGNVIGQRDIPMGLSPKNYTNEPFMRDPQGQIVPNAAVQEYELRKTRDGRIPMAPVAYVNDKGETIWGTINEARGRPAANYSPSVQGAVAGAKEYGKTISEDRAKAVADAPRIISNATEAIRLANELLAHPGMTQAVGASSLLGIQKIPGTQAKDFMNRLDQIKGSAFLEAFNTLKGGGQITEVEGKKATDAIARMDNATSEAAFKQAVVDYQNVIRTGLKRAKQKAGIQESENRLTPAEQQELEQLRAKFRGQ